MGPHVSRKTMPNKTFSIRPTQLNNAFAKQTKEMTKTFTGISILVGAIIGAGFLGIPYVLMQSGFAIGVIEIIILASVMILVMLYLGEITLRTRGEHQLVGY